MLIRALAHKAAVIYIHERPSNTPSVDFCPSLHICQFLSLYLESFSFLLICPDLPQKTSSSFQFSLRTKLYLSKGQELTFRPIFAECCASRASRTTRSFILLLWKLFQVTTALRRGATNIRQTYMAPKTPFSFLQTFSIPRLISRTQIFLFQT